MWGPWVGRLHSCCWAVVVMDSGLHQPEDRGGRGGGWGGGTSQDKHSQAKERQPHLNLQSEVNGSNHIEVIQEEKVFRPLGERGVSYYRKFLKQFCLLIMLPL